MEAILGFIFELYLCTVGISAGIKVLKDLVARNKIEDQGYTFKKSDREIQEVIYDFFKENAYVIVPFRNIKSSWKLIWGSNKKYAEQKLEKYKKDGRIVEPKKEEPKPAVEEKQPVKKPEVKVTASKEKNAELMVDEFIREIESSNDIYFVQEIRKTYRAKSKELRTKYNELAALFKETKDKTKKAEIKEEVATICRRVKAYDTLYLCAKNRQLELQNQQTNTRKK